METLFEEMFNNINVDIVFTIDATESLCPFMEKINNFILSFENQLRNVLEVNNCVIDKLRVKIIIVHKYNEENNCIFEQSKFFKLPEEQKDFYDFVSKIKVHGVDDPKGGLEALALAMQSDFTKEGVKKRHAIILFTNTSAQIISQQPDGTHSKDDSNTHMNINTLYDLWGNMNDNAKRFVMFAPDTVPWSEIEIDFENTLSMDIATINEDSSLDNTFAIIRC